MSVDAVTSEQFDSTISDHPIVIIDFWAPWCGPCRGFASVFEKAAQTHSDIKFVKVNTDQEQGLANHFGIRSIPTLMVFREQVIIFQQSGALQKSALDDLLRQVRDLDMTEVRRGIGSRDEEESPRTIQ